MQSQKEATIQCMLTIVVATDPPPRTLIKPSCSQCRFSIVSFPERLTRKANTPTTKPDDERGDGTLARSSLPEHAEDERRRDRRGDVADHGGHHAEDRLELRDERRPAKRPRSCRRRSRSDRPRRAGAPTSSGTQRLNRSYEKSVATEFNAPETVLMAAANSAAATTPRRPGGMICSIMNE